MRGVRSNSGRASHEPVCRLRRRLSATRSVVEAVDEQRLREDEAAVEGDPLKEADEPADEASDEHAPDDWERDDCERSDGTTPERSAP